MTNLESFQLLQNTTGLLPLVFDSPHSSSHFPNTFPTLASETELKTGWDAYVDELWRPAVDLGATMIAAQFSRMYIDPNRAETDIDIRLLDGEWPYAIESTEYSERGMGLLRRFALPGKPMYANPLPVNEVMMRIERYHRPYHECLRELLDYFAASFGGVWHIDCHSMKSQGNAMNIDAGAARPDIVLGDVNGASANPEFTAYIATAFKDLGYKVAINYPYKGGYCVRAYGKPALNRHSLQIEINRALYMNESAFTKNSKFSEFQADLKIVSERIAQYVNAQL
ncbi:N-formylglutamate amidohydrolase [Aliidiomarina sp.]|uniref:N-formylglutamate amidohydrolase n=1 Tax=Aliidiomarina sp. TaxID=1872439 RepID=UPI003A4D3920